MPGPIKFEPRWTETELVEDCFALVYRQSPLGPVDPSFQALSGRLKFTVRRDQFNADLFSPSVGLTDCPGVRLRNVIFEVKKCPGPPSSSPDGLRPC